MAKIKFGAGVAGIRGTIAGVTFAVNRSGAYARNWNRAPRTRTQAQQAQRNAFSIISTTWPTLTSTQRSDWDTWAALPAQEQFDAFGDGYYLSGFQWFRKFNLWRNAVGLTPRSDAPTETQPASPDSASLGYSVAIGSVQESTLTYAVDFFAGHYIVILSGQRFPSSNITQQSSPRFTHSEFDPPSASLDFFSSLEAAWSEVRANHRYILNVYMQSPQGYRSAPGTISAATQVVP